MARGGKIKFREAVTCPQCGRAGRAEYEDTESPPHHHGDSGYEPPALVGVEGDLVIRGSAIYCAGGHKVK